MSDLEKQTERTRRHVARHLLTAHMDFPEDREGCLICVTWEWANGSEKKISKEDLKGLAEGVD